MMLFNGTTVGRSSNYMTAPYSIFQLVGARLSVCDGAHLGPVCGFLAFCLQIAIALFHRSGFDYSRTSVARTPLGPWKLVRVMGSSSH